MVAERSSRRGGTPNTLTTNEIAEIMGKINSKAYIKGKGIELLSSTLDKSYLDGLKEICFDKISLGVESFAEEVMGKTGRKNTASVNIGNLIGYAKKIGLKVNVDMMVGLHNQSPQSFISGIKLLSEFFPDQITIYPFMVINGIDAKPGFPTIKQFEYIEEAANILYGKNYSRKGIWTFASGNDIYDSSRDELVIDYVGLGPAAFSTYLNYKVVNPGLEGYLKNYSLSSAYKNDSFYFLILFLNIYLFDTTKYI